jgi:hypothetical protein
MAGAAVVDGKRVMWAGSLPEGTSAQKAELIALTQALWMAEGQSINIYTNSRYAFATAHITSVKLVLLTLTSILPISELLCSFTFCQDLSIPLTSYKISTRS